MAHMQSKRHKALSFIALVALLFVVGYGVGLLIGKLL
jgi:hypothetical protein